MIDWKRLRNWRALACRPGVWLVLVVISVPMACTSHLADDLTEITEVKHLQVVNAASGELLVDEKAAPLPSRVDSPAGGGLRHISFEIPLDHYLQAQVAPEPGARVPPGRSLLFSQAAEGMDVYLNGVWVAGLPRTDATVRYRWSRPLVVPLARRLLRSDQLNTVVVELSSQDSRTVLPPLYVGSVSGANVVFELTSFIGSSMANASNLLCLLAGLFLMGAGRVSEEDGRPFVLAGALTSVWAVLFWLVLLPRVPTGWLAAREWLQYVCLGAVLVLMTQFVFAFIEERMAAPVQRAMWLAVMAVPAVYPVAGPELRGWLAQYWLPVLLLFYLYATVRLARHAVRTRRRAAFLLLGLSILMQVFALHDHNVVAQLLPLSIPGPGWSLAHLLVAPMLLSHFTMPLLLLVMGQGLLDRIRSYVERIRRANDELRHTLAQRERELRISYQRQRDMENEAAAQSERDRIYRELHDGIGSKLVTTLFSVRGRELNHGQLEHRLLDALRDLRETISVTQPRDERPIQDIVFSYASSVDEALSGDHFHVEIDVAEGQEAVLLGEEARSLLRILEETVANTVKYAGATRLRLTLKVDERDVLCLSIDDNGQGLETALDRHPSASFLSGGRGLDGMRERAREMGGRYRFVRTRQGAHTRIRLPLGPAVTSVALHEVKARAVAIGDSTGSREPSDRSRSDAFESSLS